MIRKTLAAISILAAFALGTVVPDLLSDPPRPSIGLAVAAAQGATPLPTDQPGSTTVTVPTSSQPVKVTLESPPSSDELPDPQLDPSGFWEALRLWWSTGGKVPAVLVVVIALLRVLPQRISWLAVGWRKAVAALALVLASTLLDTWLSSGAAGNLWMWLLGGVGAVVTYLSAPKGPPPSTTPQAGAR